MKKIEEFKDILGRYLLLLVSSLKNLGAFYLIFTPLTIYPVYWVLRFFFGATLEGSTIYVMGNPIEMIAACIAGSAYYLLFIFNLSTPGIKIKKRINLILMSFLVFLIANILRILFLSVMFIYGLPFFDAAHLFFWYFGSVILVILIWFYQVKKYNLKSIPFYSDLKFLLKEARKFS